MNDQPVRFFNRHELLNPSSANADDAALVEEIKTLLKKENAVIVAHYYTDDKIQLLAEATGGFVADSLEMARFGRDHPAATLVVAGVRFMGETAKILSPDKRVLMPTLEATCSLDESAPPETFIPFCDAHPDRTVVVYANTRAAIKARADWVVTSSNAVAVIRHLHEQGHKILFAPDKHLGHYIADQTGADMLIWDGACIVHESFKATALAAMKQQHPHAAVLVHPESPREVIALADVVGSTSTLINAVRDLPNPEFIVATEPGIFHAMRQQAPAKKLVEAPTAGRGATCESCAHCPWMQMNSLERVRDVLIRGDQEIVVDEAIRRKALRATERMLSFRAA